MQKTCLTAVLVLMAALLLGCTDTKETPAPGGVGDDPAVSDPAVSDPAPSDPVDADADDTAADDTAAEANEPAASDSTNPADATDADADSTGSWQPAPEPVVDAKYRPSLYLTLPAWCPTPDGMTLDDATGVIYLNCPNYAEIDEATGKKRYPAVLCSIDKDGNLEKLLTYEGHPETDQCGPMGMDIGPDGHLYVADNQYFEGEEAGTYGSRVLRVEMQDGKPTGKVDVVVDGTSLSNALIWYGDHMYLSDTFLDMEGHFGGGGIWHFTKEELDGGPVAVDKTGDPHLVQMLPVKERGRGDAAGADGMTIDSEGNLYAGNFGDGVIFKMAIGADGQLSPPEVVVDQDDFECCDGVFYDKATDTIYINDSQANAIRTLTPDGAFDTLWINGDTDGADGLLDQPAECLVRDGKLIIVNFDWTFPGLKNKAHDAPHTLSVIDLGTGEAPASDEAATSASVEGTATPESASE